MIRLHGRGPWGRWFVENPGRQRFPSIMWDVRGHGRVGDVYGVYTEYGVLGSLFGKRTLRTPVPGVYPISNLFAWIGKNRGPLVIIVVRSTHTGLRNYTRGLHPLVRMTRMMVTGDEDARWAV